jgi:hypothetical protein
MITAANLFLAATVALPPPAVGFLSRHPELLAGTARCVVTNGLVKLAPSLEGDLNGDTSQDVAFVVRSASSPPMYGVMALHFGASRPSAEHWVVPLSRAPVAGIGTYKDPFATWVIVATCSGDAQPYLWTGRRYERTGIHE